ncbi:unnamed protein product [Sphagnum troendelagicum]
MVRSRDNSPVDDKPFVNVLGNLHSDLGDALDNFVSYIRGRQDADMDDEDLVRVHTMLLHICRPPTCQVVQQEPQIACPIMRFLILVRPSWQPDHPAVPWCEVDEWLACVRDNAKDTPFNGLRETMRLACTVLGDGPDIPRLVRIGLMACTIDGQAVTIDTLRNLVGALLYEANKVMNNQLLLGLQTAWIRRSFIVGLSGNVDAAQQHMNLWAIQRDAAMDGEDVSRLVATAFLEYANLDLGIADYRHLAAYFGGAIK